MGEYEKAIEFLSELYNEHPYFTDAEHYLLDALFALGKNESDFDWVEKPVVLRLSDELLEAVLSKPLAPELVVGLADIVPLTIFGIGGLLSRR